MLNLHPGFGPLIAEHLICERACLGLLPSWFRSYSKLHDQHKAVTQIREKYSLGDEMRGNRLDSFLVSLSTALSNKYQHEFTLRDSENILCKSYRLTNNSDAKFVDCYLDGGLQPLAVFGRELCKF